MPEVLTRRAGIPQLVLLLAGSGFAEVPPDKLREAVMAFYGDGAASQGDAPAATASRRNAMIPTAAMI